MLKFIACDLDGTLLTPLGALPEEIFPIVRRLAAQGVLFAPASGRQCANLELLFAPVKDELIFIAENGSLVRRREKRIYLNPLAETLAKPALDAVRNYPGLFPVLCAEKNAYIENEDEPFASRTRRAYSNCVSVPSLDGCLGREPVCKISVFDPSGAKDYAMRVLPPRLPDGAKITLSGEHWCDIAVPTADKGEALREIQSRLHLKKNECMALGDQMNDIGMLLACEHSAAVENALPEVKKIAKYILPSNAEKGVITALNELLKRLEKGENHV